MERWRKDDIPLWDGSGGLSFHLGRVMRKELA